jgi:hypothetical protein
MRRLALFAVFLLCLAGIYGSAGQVAPPAHTADWVARQIQDRDAGRDSRAEMRMRLFDRQGRVRERALSIQTLTSPPGDRVLLRFTYPNDIKGTAFLVWEHPGGDDERFLHLPALGRVRRIAGAEKEESFVGSDLSYEDIGGRDIADYSYTFTDADAIWSAPDGSKHPVWALQSRSNDRRARYPRSVSLVLKDRFIIVHGDIFNQRDEPTKTFDVRRLERIQGIWTVMELVVANERDRTRTVLTTTSIRYNTGLTADDFTRRRLEEAR